MNIETLRLLRTNPRKLRHDYLKSQGIDKYIDKNIDESIHGFSWKEKIDILIHNHKDKCICGKLTKYGQTYCSVKCVNTSTIVQNKIGDANRKNSKSRTRVMKKTLLKRYGVSAVQDIPHVKAKTKIKKLEYYDNVFRETFKKYKLDYDKYNDKAFIEKICKDIAYPSLSKKHFNDMPIMTIFRFIKRLGANVEFQKSSSAGERNVAEWLRSLGFTVETNVRSVISPKELDIYIPEKNLAIEFNGLYFHRDDKYGSRDKFRLCEKAGIKLIQVFEDEWYFKEDIVKSIICSKLGISDRRIWARQCRFDLVNSKDAKAFLESNHIQGAINGKHFGLFYGNVLVSIFTVGKCRYFSGMELLRYASKLDTTVIGGFSKLLTNVKKTLSLTELKTYADLRYSVGNTYAKFGTFVRETVPGYFWTTSNSISRVSRYQTQKHKLKKLLKTKYDKTMSELENMTAAKYHKIYDAGHRLYVI